jgi:hypothetical protein
MSNNFLNFLIESTLEYHSNLQEDFWQDDNLNPTIRKHLIEIAKQFYKSSELDKNVFKIDDVIFTGSLCNYNYTKYSDIDLHIILSVSKEQCNDCGIDLETILDNAKNLFNAEHDITIYEYPVELYFQLSDDHLAASGIYSIKNNKWLSHPEFDKDLKFNNKLIDIKSHQIIKKIDDIVDGNDYRQLRALSHKLKRYRQAGLEKFGEFSIENLVYKNVRNLGYLDKLKKAKLYAMDSNLSLHESTQLLAPNGKPSNLNPLQYQMVRTKEFKRFFGDWENDPQNSSKIVDGNGEPLNMWHGTSHKFTEFNSYKPNFFTHDKEYSKVYAHKNKPMGVFLNIRNPFDTRHENDRNFYNNEFIPYFKNRFSRLADGIESLKSGEMVSFIWADYLFSALRTLGRNGKHNYDGIYVNEGDTPKIVNSSAEIAIVPMFNTQIKSAIKNINYNPELENIHEAKLPPKYSTKEISGILPKHSVIGSGYQALVYESSKHPNSVVKIIPITGENDPTYQFLRLCVNSKNPYFPKIYSYKTYNTKKLTPDDLEYLKNSYDDFYLSGPGYINAKYLLFIVVEKLEHSDDIIKLLQDVGLPLTDDDYVAVQSYFHTKAARKSVMNYTTDINFKNALRHLEPLFANYNPDLHIDNFMVRNDGHLVINDPVVDSHISSSMGTNTFNIVKRKSTSYTDNIIPDVSTKLINQDEFTNDAIKLFKRYKDITKNDVKNLSIEQLNTIKKVYVSIFKFFADKDKYFDQNLNESTVPSNNIQEFIKTNCKPFLQMINNDTSKLLYRGISRSRHDDKDNAFIDSGFYHNRKTSGLSLENHNILNDLFLKKFNKPFMNGLFTTGSKVQADEYGYIYAIFPIGKFNFVYNPNIHDMFYGLEYGKDKPTEIINGYTNDNLKNGINAKKEIILYCDKVLYVPIDMVNEIFNIRESFLEYLNESSKLLAPNGKPSNLNPMQYKQVRTKEFKRFFGDWENDPKNSSKIIDENGEPLPVMHGTYIKDDFSKFIGKAIMFTPDIEKANKFGSNRIYSVFLNIRKPKIVQDVPYVQGMPYGYSDHRRNDLIDKGYDGAIYSSVKNILKSPRGKNITPEYAVFNSTQIKSAIGNNGNYNPELENIHESFLEYLNESYYYSTLKDVEDYWDSLDIDYFINESDDVINLSKIIVPKSLRNSGLGSKAMQALTDYADISNKKIILSPSNDFGGSKGRLEKFYKSFGFISNKGKNKDYNFRETMYRYPK